MGSVDNFESDYMKIANMSNKEAAKLLESVLALSINFRSNGKSLFLLKYDIAIQKAIEALNNTPD